MSLTLLSLLGVGPNVGPLQPQKRLPPRRPFRRPEGDVIVVIVNGEELLSEGGDPMRRRGRRRRIVLEGQQPSLEEELVGAAHGGVVGGDGEFEVRRDRRLRSQRAPDHLLPESLLGVDEVIGEGDSGAHGSEVVVVVVLVVVVISFVLGVVHV